MKKVAILGSTGSIGTQTLEIIRDNKDLCAVALAAGQNVDLMEAQIREFQPLIAGMWSEEAAGELRRRVADLPVKIVSGMDGLLEIASMKESDVVVTGVVGMIGIRPTIAAIESKKTIALANKEDVYKRQIYYLNDEARVYEIEHGTGASIEGKNVVGASSKVAVNEDVPCLLYTSRCV